MVRVPGRLTTPRSLLLGAFFVSGASGLAYEIVWSRYLALLLGHGAHAQVLVIAVYLGGMALGSLLVGDLSKRLGRPLRWYVLAELALAASGLAFHAVYRIAAEGVYGTAMPALAGTMWTEPVRWGLAALLILPQAVLLGTTFPLVAAAIHRRFPSEAGRTVADVYLWNTLGGALGVLVTGFVVLGLVGMTGALTAAALGNGLAAVTAWGVSRGWPVGGARGARGQASATTGSGEVERTLRRAGKASTVGGPREESRVLWWVFLAVSFFSAAASFLYEVAWIRMLSLLMGSATHSLELMLSAFILGLAVGSWLVRGWTDRMGRPVEAVAALQWLMGLTALATLPFYLLSFDAVAYMVGELGGRAGGYALFNLSRYGLALVVMLPSTVLAGMTLPLITGTLLRAGLGERSIGWVYGSNALGSVVGVAIGGLFLLPMLGLKGVLAVGAATDMALGVGLLAWVAWRKRPEVPGASHLLPGAALALGAAAVAGVGALRMDRAVLTGGVFRHGTVPSEEVREVLFYEDGRTASVGVHVLDEAELMVLTTNGKPDASLPFRWLRAARGWAVETTPIRSQDVSTQLLAPLVMLAHRPGAARGINIGHGSGMSAQVLLGSPLLERLVTVEIEPAVVRASRTFLPANDRAFGDARHDLVFEDARAHLAHATEPVDFVFSEPSNPWVSGAADLFTVEFYRRVRKRLAPGGIFGQWLQLYEMEDELLLTVLAAVHEVFPAYTAYLVGDADVLVVASASSGLADPDWTVFEHPGVRQTLAHVPPFEESHLEALRILERADLAPLLTAGRVLANSDFFPRLDLGAERARFNGLFAGGTYSLVAERFDLLRTLRGERRERPPYHPVPAWGLEPVRDQAFGAWMGEALAGRRRGPPPYPEWSEEAARVRRFLRGLEGEEPPADWGRFTRTFQKVEARLHAGTAGWTDEAFYEAVRAYAERSGAPPQVDAAVDLVHGAAAWNFGEVVDAARLLTGSGHLQTPPVSPAFLLDATVVAMLKLGRRDDARAALERLAPLAGRSPDHLRTRLLAAWVGRGEGGGS